MRIGRYGENRQAGHGHLRKSLAVVALGALIALQAISVAQADYGSARVWFHSQSVAERNRLQSELYWSGDYVGRIDATFGPLTYAALQSLQLRTGGQPTGVLDAQQTAYLHVDARRVRTVLDRIRTERPQPRYIAPRAEPPRYYGQQTVLILP